MPRPPGAGNELHQRPGATDDEVCRDTQGSDRRVVWMRPRIEPIGKQFDDTGPLEAARRQGNIMDDQ